MAREEPGPISHERISDGIQACIEHAEQLVASSRLLLTQCLHSQAAMLALLASEELGKIQLLRKMVILAHNDPQYWRVVWRELLRSHETKAALSLHEVPIGALATDGAMRENMLRFEAAGQSAKQRRASYMYIDFDPDSNSWIVPTRISQEGAESELRIAEKQLEMHQLAQRAGAYTVSFLTEIQALYKQAAKMNAALAREFKAGRASMSDLGAYHPLTLEWKRSQEAELRALFRLLLTSEVLSPDEKTRLRGLLGLGRD